MPGIVTFVAATQIALSCGTKGGLKGGLKSSYEDNTSLDQEPGPQGHDTVATWRD